MGRKKRIRRNTQRNMHSRMITGKKPMSIEQKKVNKEAREAQKERTKVDLVKRTKADLAKKTKA